MVFRVILCVLMLYNALKYFSVFVHKSLIEKLSVSVNNVTRETYLEVKVKLKEETHRKISKSTLRMIDRVC